MVPEDSRPQLEVASTTNHHPHTPGFSRPKMKAGVYSTAMDRVRVLKRQKYDCSGLLLLVGSP